MDALYSFRESSDNIRGYLLDENEYPWDRELLRRGLETDPSEPRDPIRDMSLGYSASIGIMALSHIVPLEAQVRPLCLTRLSVLTDCRF